MLRRLAPLVALLLTGCGTTPTVSAPRTAVGQLMTSSLKAPAKAAKPKTVTEDAAKGAAPGSKTDAAATKPNRVARQGIGSEIVGLAHAYGVLEDVGYGASYYHSLGNGQRNLSYLQAIYQNAPAQSAQEAMALIAIGKLGAGSFPFLVKEYRGAAVQSRRESAALIALGMVGTDAYNYLVTEYRGATTNSLRETASLVGLGLVGPSAQAYLQNEYRGASTDGEREAASLVGLGLVGPGSFNYLVTEYRGATVGGKRELGTVVGLCLSRAATSQDYAHKIYNETKDARVRAAVDFGLDQARRL